jgi:uncharacterized membrane protein YeaQ/YmgE (transglycosylase-associated protein family)
MSGCDKDGNGFMSLFMWMVLGAAGGWLASRVMKNGSYGEMAEIALGVGGGVVGGIVTGLVLNMNTVSGFNAETMGGAVLVAAAAIVASRVYRHSRAAA